MLKKEWSIILPLLALLALIAGIGAKPSGALLILGGLLIVGAVIAAVHHAEVIALRVGEPYGSIILAVAVTVIEVSLILAVILQSGDKAASLARDTVFSAVMIACAGVVGLSLVTSSIRHHTARFNPEGTASALATVITLAVLALVLPTFTDARPGPEFSPVQLAFAAGASLLLYVMFLFMQTVRHRDYFLPAKVEDGDQHAERPSLRSTLLSLCALLISLVAVVGLAKLTSPAIEDALSSIGAPASAVGVVIALIVLLPESLAAVRNAASGRMQTSFNLAYGSAMASVGLTIPALALATVWIDTPLILGLGPVQIVLLLTTSLVAALTVLPGKATLQEGALHLVLLAAFVLLAFIP